MRAVLTGASGYLGSHLLRRLHETGWDVLIVARPSSVIACEFQTLRYTNEIGPLRQGIAAFKPDVVFHLAAALARYGHTGDDIDNLIFSNIQLSTHLAEAAVDAAVPAFVDIGTHWQYYHSMQYRPVNLYAATKQAFQDILRYYADAYPLAVSTLILYDVYGSNDPRPKIINLLRRALNTGEEIPLSPGEQLLDLIFVDDAIEAMIQAADLLLHTQKPEYHSWTVRTGQLTSLRELVATMESVWKKAILVKWGGLPYRARDVMRPWTGGQTVPDWRPETDLVTGLRRIMNEDLAVSPGNERS